MATQGKVILQNKYGLHMRPATKVIETCNRFGHCSIYLIKDGKRYDAKSIIEIMTIGAEQGSELIIETSGQNEIEALDALQKLFEVKFNLDEE